MSENIIKSYPELSIFDVEYEGEVFDCRKCLSVEKCCGAQNQNFNDNLACIKCRCQYLYDVIDSSRENKVGLCKGFFLEVGWGAFRGLLCKDSLPRVHLPENSLHKHSLHKRFLREYQSFEGLR